MSTFHCGKLCECRQCFPVSWALRDAREYEGKPRTIDDVRWELLGLFYREESRNECEDAWAAIHDPNKFAELMAMALRARGFTIEAVWYGAVAKRSYPCVRVKAGVWNDKPMILIELWDITNVAKISNGIPQMFFFEHTQARTKLLAVMSTPADESSFDVTKRIISAG